MKLKLALPVTAVFLGFAFRVAQAQTVRSASGPSAASIQAAVDAFRADLGALNPNTPGSVGSGRREINWDAVPDALSAPNNLPADFFNANVAPRARGVIFSTPGTGFQVSAKADNPTSTLPDFGNLNPGYPALFAPFSPERLFTALGSTVTDVRFFVPGSSTPALVKGFSAIFSHVTQEGQSKIDFFDSSDRLVSTQTVPAQSGTESFSFAGTVFTRPLISRVRITSGAAPLGDRTGEEVAVMDDFLYGEPIPVSSSAADTTPPMIEGPDEVRVYVKEAGTDAVVYTVQAKDDREGTVNLSCTPPSGSVLILGTHAVSCQATDAAGNVATKNFSLVVRPLGDLNGDGKINVSDATLSLQIVVGSLTPTPDQRNAGDFNQDDRINVQDTTLILRRAVGL
jgi:hypothetical protein